MKQLPYTNYSYLLLYLVWIFRTLVFNSIVFSRNIKVVNTGCVEEHIQAKCTRFHPQRDWVVETCSLSEVVVNGEGEYKRETSTKNIERTPKQFKVLRRQSGGWWRWCRKQKSLVINVEITKCVYVQAFVHVLNCILCSYLCTWNMYGM